MRKFTPRNSWRFTIHLLLAMGLLLGTIAPVWGPAASARGASEAASPAGSSTPHSARLVVVDVAGPESAGPGETISLTVIVNNVGVAPVRAARVHMRETAGAGISGRAVQPLPEIAVGEQAEVEFSGRVNADAGEELRITFEVKGDIDQPASGMYRAMVHQDAPDVWQVQAGAGTWQVSELLDLAWAGPPDPQVIRVYHRALYPESERDSRSIYRFQLWAKNGSGAEVTSLAQPLRLRWQVGERLAGRPNIAPVLRLWNPAAQRWQHVATRLHAAAGYIEAELRQGGVYDVQGGVEEAAEDPAGNLAANVYSGALQFDYALPLLARPHGFAPGLGLSYSSRRREMDDAFGSNGSLLGWGWRLEGLGHINWVQNTQEYNLALNGHTYTLKDTGSPVWWYSPEAPWLKVSRAGEAQNAEWHIYTPDGRRYTFSPVQTAVYCDKTEASEQVVEAAKTFMLTAITDAADVDAFHYKLNIAYNEGISEVTRQIEFYCALQDRNLPYVFQALPTSITYSGAPGASVIFDYVDRADLPADCTDLTCANLPTTYFYYHSKTLQRVRVQVNGELARVYEFDSSLAGASKPRLVLDSVRTLGKGGGGDLPAATFEYRNESGCEFWGNCYLEVLNNGQGGSTRMAYTQEGSAVYHPVTRIERQDGFGGSQVQDIWYNNWNEKADGHDFSIVTHLGEAGDATDDRYDKHWFYNDDLVKKTVGLEYQSVAERVTPAGARLNWEWRVYGDLPLPPPPGGGTYADVRQTLQETTLYVYDELGAGEEEALHTRLRYELDHQGGYQGGNVTHVEEYLPVDGVRQLLRTTERQFYPSDTIKDRLAEEWVWAGAAGGACQAYRRLYYDGAGLQTQPPTQGLLTRVEAAKTGCDATGGDLITLNTNTYEPTWNNLVRVTDERGSASFGYDSVFHTAVVTTTNALTQTTTFSYAGLVDQALGRRQSETDANGATTAYTYDAHGRLLTVDRPDYGPADEVWAYYNYAGATQPRRVEQRVKDEVAGTGAFDQYLVNWTYYDGLGRVIQQQAEAEDANKANVESYAYDGYGRLQKQSMPYQISQSPGVGYLPINDWATLAHTRTDYDPFGRITAIVQPDGSQTRYGYRYLQTAVIDANNHQTITETDGFGRLVSSLQYEYQYSAPDWGAASYFAATYEYDVLNNLRFVRDRNQVTTEMQYDALSRKTGMSDPNMGAWGYTYDNASNLQTQTDARGCVTTFGYDALSRLTGKSYVGPGACGTTTAVSYSYDAYDGVTQFGRGRRTGMTDGSGSTAWVYDERGRVTQETKLIGTASFVTAWSYDAADRVQTTTYPSPETETVTYAYNPQGLLESITSSLGPSYVESSVYDAASRLTQRVMANSETAAWTTDYAYYPWNTANGLGRLQNIATGALQNLTYTYDAVGNVKTIVDGSNSSQRQCFNYDELDRLTQGYSGNSGCTAYAAIGNGPYEEQYTLAANGNLNLRKIVSPAYQEIAYTYNAPSPGGCAAGTAATKPHAASQAGGNAYSYDCNGNMTVRTVGGSSYTLTYDEENHLTEVKQGSTVQATFVYDGDGNRVQATVGGVTTFYPGKHFEYVGDTTYTKYYFAGSDLLAFERSPGYGATTGYGRRFVLRDHLGSTSVIVNGSNVTIADDLYLPHGDVRYQWRTGAPPIATQTQYRYTGQRLETGIGAPAATWNGVAVDRGLYFYGARWYDASLARFMQADTIVPQPGNPQSLNRYTYAENSPVVYADPSGHWVESAIDIAFLAYDVYDIQQNGLSWENGLSLAADVGGLILPIATGGGLAVRAAFHADDVLKLASHGDEVVDAAKAVDAGVEAYRTARGGGIHPATTGKAFSDWFKTNILKNPAAKGRNFPGRRLDIVDDAGTLVNDGAKQIYELKNYTPKTSIGKKFWEQAEAYKNYANQNEYDLNYVFGQQISDDIARRLQGMGIKTWYIDDTGQMIEWIVR